MKYLIPFTILITFSCSSKKASENTESNSGKLITREEFGDKWPFTVEKGFLACTENRIVFTAEGNSYGVNGTAKSSLKNLSEIEDIWAIDSAYYNPESTGSPIRKSIGPILDAGKELCE